MFACILYHALCFVSFVVPHKSQVNNVKLEKKNVLRTTLSLNFWENTSNDPTKPQS